MLEMYRGYAIYQDEKGIYYERKRFDGTGVNRWYFPSLEDAKLDIDIWLDY